MSHRTSTLGYSLFLLSVACAESSDADDANAEVVSADDAPSDTQADDDNAGGTTSMDDVGNAGASPTETGTAGEGSGEEPDDVGDGEGGAVSNPGAAGASGSAAGGGAPTGDGGASPTGGAGGATSDGVVPTELDFAPGEVCDRAERIGTFKVALGDDRTSFSGTITDAVVPAAVFEVLAEDGPCQLLGPRSLFCEPECSSGTTCDGDGSCIPTPANFTVGDVTVSGLLDPLDVGAHPITASYSSSILEPFPAFEAGAAISLSAAGEGAIGPFTLDATGVGVMKTDGAGVAIQRGMPAVFTWNAAGGDPATSAVYIDITVNPHGSTTGWIECVVEDAGEFEVPASLVTQLVDLGLSGFPRATLGRRSTDGVMFPDGCVDFRVSSDVTVNLEVEGLTSCNTHSECADGQMCSVELFCEDVE